MVKKQFIQVKGNPLYALPAKANANLKCPTTGLIALCQFPPCAHFKGGLVYLREGKHQGSHHGFGFQHIWKERHPTETDRVRAEIKVFANVRAVLIVGASIHYEGGTGRDYGRASIAVRSPTGMVVVEERADGDNVAVYSIVTYIPTNPKGELIGRIL
jgi:hypothetical protein